MDTENYDTLSEAINSLTEKGYKENFEAKEDYIVALYSKRKYRPDELKIVASHRFEGMTNPQDATAAFAIRANDGTLGTLVISYSAAHNQNMELIQQIPEA